MGNEKPLGDDHGWWISEDLAKEYWEGMNNV